MTIDQGGISTAYPQSYPQLNQSYPQPSKSYPQLIHNLKRSAHIKLLETTQQTKGFIVTLLVSSICQFIQ
jgi:hypothetical protein